MKFIKITLAFIVVVLAFWAGLHVGRDSTNQAVKKEDSGKADNKISNIWTCSMHPQIRQSNPGKCPLCGMDLIPLPQTGPSAGDSSSIALSPHAEKLAEVETAPVIRKFAEVEIRMLGKIAFNEETLALITARMPGRIDKLYVNYTGIAVRKGDHIAEVYSPELLLAQQELIQSLSLLKTMKNNDEFAKRTLNDVKEKYRLWGFSEEQVQEIIKRGKISDHLTITAPIQGIVIEKHVNEGKYFNKGEKLFTIADLNQVWVNLEAYELDLPWIKYGEEADFTVEAYPGKTFKGMIAFIQPFLNENTRTVMVRLNADNHEGLLKPGMFVNAVIHAKLAADGKILNSSLSGKWISPMHPEIIKDAPGTCDICGMPLVTAESLGFADPNDKNLKPPLLIPATAPLITGKRAVVYVAVPGKKGTYEGREIVLGPRAGAYYIVSSGLKEGEQVVTRGNFKIDSALQIQAQPSMMSMPAEGKTTDKPAVPAEYIIPDDIIGSYLAVHKALFSDNLDDALKNAGKLDSRYSTKLSSAKDMASAREIFYDISVLLYREIISSGGKPPRKLYKFFCPMAFENKGAFWLQDADATQNPYFGTVMPACGELKDTIPGAK